METNQGKQIPRTPTKERLKSLDTLRGFDMAMLVGGCGVVTALADATSMGWLDGLATQMHHVGWEGFRFYDLIFPLFMFISGAAIPYGITSKLEKGISSRVLFKKILWRFIALVLFGIIYNGALRKGFTDLRYASVLGQIGVGYFFAALIFLYARRPGRIILWLTGIMAAVAVLQLFVPAPGYEAGSFEKGANMNAWLDQLIIPGRLHNETFDPEGVLCMISAIAVTLMGGLSGYVIRSFSGSMQKKALWLALGGALAILLALALSPVYPIIKKMWTVPYVLLAGGVSTLLLSLFYFVIDVKGINKWTPFFIVFGMNSITIYLGVKILDFGRASRFFLGWTRVHISEAWGEVFLACGVLILQWALMLFLYRKRIFLRI
jgi:predicted acyltransferase